MRRGSARPRWKPRVRPSGSATSRSRRRRGEPRFAASGAHQGGAPVEPRAEPDEADELAVLDAPGLARLVERDGDGGGGGVAVALDVVEDLFVRQLQGLLQRFIDAQ